MSKLCSISLGKMNLPLTLRTMAVLEQAIKDFKDLLRKRNIDLHGRLVIYFGESYECSFVYKPSCPSVHPNNNSKETTSNFKNKPWVEVGKDDGILCSPFSFNSCNFVNTLQTSLIPKTKTTLPPFENIMKMRGSKRIQNKESHLENEARLSPEVSKSFDQFYDTFVHENDACKNEVRIDREEGGLIKFNERNISSSYDFKNEIDFRNENCASLDKMQSPVTTESATETLDDSRKSIIHSSTMSSLLDLVQNNKEMTSSTKKMLLNCLDDLCKEDLLHVFIQLYDVLKKSKMTSHHKTDDGNNEMVSNATDVDQGRSHQNLINFAHNLKDGKRGWIPLKPSLQNSDIDILINEKEKILPSIPDIVCEKIKFREVSHLYQHSATVEPLQDMPCVNDGSSNLDNNETVDPFHGHDNNSSPILENNLSDFSGVELHFEAREPVTKYDDFVCKTCSSTFSSEESYWKHLQTHAQSYKCDICGKILKSKDSLYHHQRGLHSKEKPYHCNICDGTFSFHHSYKLHLQRHKGERPFECKLCPKTYLTSNHLKEHVRAVHTSNFIMCHICGKKFSYVSALKLHLHSHSIDKPHKCSGCNKRFSSKHALKRHETSHLRHEKFRCDVCLKYFKSGNSLKLHSKLHNKLQDKCYPCNFCSKSFSYKCILESHIQIHNQFRSYVCSICGKAFKSKASLYTHKYVHNEGKAFSCLVCSKSFKTKNCLLAHTKRHQNQETFECQICGSKFPDKGGLSKHTKTVHLPRKYFCCKICERTGTRADNMRTHVKSHRKEIGPTDDPMNFISCVEKLDRSQNRSDGESPKKKNKEKRQYHIPQTSDNTQPKSSTNINEPCVDLFFPDNVSMLPSVQSLSESSSVNISHACSPLMTVSEGDVKGVQSKSCLYQPIPSSTMDGKNYIFNSNPDLYQQALSGNNNIFLSNSSSPIASNLAIPSSVMLHQAHHNFRSTMFHNVPHVNCDPNPDSALTQFNTQCYENL